MLDNQKAVDRISNWLFVIMAVLVIGAAGMWLYRSDYFPIRSVKVDGKLRHTDAAQVRQIAQQVIRGNILNVDLNRAKQAYMTLPWIAEVHVRRKLPDGVEITLVEREPVALWADGGIVDSRGEVFQAALSGEWPVLEGPEGSAKKMVTHFQDFSRMLGKEGLKIKQLNLSPRSAWQVHLDNGVEIRLGREHENERLQRFVTVWQAVLKPQQATLAYVDMRYKDGFAVRSRPQSDLQAASEAAQPVLENEQ